MTEEGFFDNPFLNDTYWVIATHDLTGVVVLADPEEPNIMRVPFFEREENARDFSRAPGCDSTCKVHELDAEKCCHLLELYLKQHGFWGVIFLSDGQTMHLDFKAYMMLSTGPGGGYSTIEA